MNYSADCYKGFTFIECLITVALIGILATIAIASSSTWFLAQQSHLVIDQLTHALQFARQQALLHKTIVTVCPLQNEQTCQPIADWSKGYLIFIDPDGQGKINNSTSLLHINKLQTKGLLSNTRQYVQFAATGFSRNTNSTFNYQQDDKIYQVIINMQGRIRVQN